MTDPPPALGPPRRTLAFMLLTGYVPLLHLALTLAVGLVTGHAVAWWAGLLAGVATLYLLPPLAVRLAHTVAPLTPGKHAPDSPAFRAWWFAAQWQVLFNRLPQLEEILRLIPSAYSMWLRLWGARVGALVYWSPGCTVLDRSLVDVGDRVVIGLGTRLHPHLLTPREDADGNREADPAGAVELWLAPVTIGAGSLVGGFSLLAPGVTVAPGSVTPAVHALPAFSEWEQGRRVRRARPTVV